MKKILLVSLLLFSIFQVEAQTSNLPADSAYTRYKWEIGTDVLWLVNKNTVPYSVLLRIHKDNLTAYRFRVGGNYIENTNPLGGGKIYAGTGLNKMELNLFLNVGKEWQKQFAHFRVIFGNDLFASYNLIRSEFNIIPRNDKYYPVIKIIDVGISPFIGGQYFIHPHLSISTEAHLNLSYYQSKITQLDFTIPDQPVENFPLVTQKNSFLKAEFLPIYFINLNYHF